METLRLPFADPLLTESETGERAPVIAFPAQPATVRNRAMLTAYLRDLADYIEQGSMVTEPFALTVVLTGPEQHEFLFKGYDGASDALMESVSVPRRYYGNPTRMGKNIFRRGSDFWKG